MIRILGIDPGSHLTGYGVIEIHSGQASYIGSGCIRVRGEQLADRLQQLFIAIQEIISEYAPHEVAVESVFVYRNVDSALKLGQARGAVITAVATRGIPVVEYTPSQIKKAVVGRGNATKLQVQHMIKALLSLQHKPQADAADALAIAVCHGHSRVQQRRLGKLAVARPSRWRLRERTR